MLGRHFLLISDKLPNVRRYYTICNCLVPTVYMEYLRVIYELTRKDNVCRFDDTLFVEEDTDTVALTIKDYKLKGGLS